jgi:hypothetical protein
MFEKAVNPHYAHEVRKFGEALKMKRLLIDAEVSNRQDKALVTGSVEVIDGYLKELRHRLRLVDGYRDDFDRLLKLKMTIRGAEPLLHSIRNADDIPHTAHLFYQWLSNLVTDLSGTIFFIEQRYPEQKAEFDADRQAFADLINSI